MSTGGHIQRYPQGSTELFPLVGAESFFIPKRRKMSEQMLDLDTFQSFLNQNADPQFYEEFYNAATSNDTWKTMNRLTGLPTPPLTPGLSDCSLAYTQDSCPGIQEVPAIKTNQVYHQEDFNGNVAFQSSYPPHSYLLSPVSPRKRHFPCDQDANQFLSYNVPYSNHDNYYMQNGYYVNSAEHLKANSTFVTPQTYSRVPFNKQYASTPLTHYNSSPTSAATDEIELMSVSQMKMSEDEYYPQAAYEEVRSHHLRQDVEPELSRASHNVLERQRRNELKNKFNMLRDTIPALSHNEKAPKIQILKQGLTLLAGLKAQEQKLTVDLELEKQRKKILLSRLQSLQDSINKEALCQHPSRNW